MANKYLYFHLMIAFICFSGLCNAANITGIYKGPDSWLIQLGTGNTSTEYKLIYGDIAESASNCENSKFSICLLFDFVDILIPGELVVGEKHEYLGSTVNVTKHLPEVNFGNAVFSDVYTLIVTRSGSLYFKGQNKKRPGGKNMFELLYSAKNGLIAFRELPGDDREDYFVIDWRSLENRGKANSLSTMSK